MAAKVSICIPAYKAPDLLRRALRSCIAQNFTDFEIVITDDSPAGALDNVLSEFKSESRIKYFHNLKPLGSPENWNQAVRMATGEYIKMLHHDDWFLDESSLGKFVQLLDNSPDVDFAFAGSLNSNSKGDPLWGHAIQPGQLKQLRQDPGILFRGNFIGAPSATIYKKRLNIEYDKQLKWVVDIDFYIRCLKKNKPFAHTTALLVAITTGSTAQVTADIQNNTIVEIFEHVHVYNKFRKLYTGDMHCTFHLWSVFTRYHVKSIDKLIECGVKPAQIGDDIRTLIYFNKLNDQMRKLFISLQKLLSPIFWTNKILRRLTLILMRARKGAEEI